MPRRYPRWQDAVGTIVAGLWPVVITLIVLGEPSRFNPVALYSGLGNVPLRTLTTQPTTDPNLYATAYSLGIHAASLLAHGHLGWWNPYEGLGAPLIGELQSGGLFPFNLLLLFHDGPFIFHVGLELIAGVATYWLLRELRCGPVVSAIGGMLFATNGTFALLGNAAFNPVCFLPLLLLGVERARRAALDGRGGGWRWLAVGGAFMFLAGFIETAVLGVIFAIVVGIQRGFTLPREKVVPYVRKAAAGLASAVAIGAPVLVAFRDYLLVGFVAEHAGNAANRVLAGPYVTISVAPYLLGRLYGNAYPVVHGIWGAIGGYAGFALLALGVASLFGRRQRGLRITLAAWVGVALADTMGVQPFRWLFSRFPALDHIILYRYLPPTWELALVVLAAFALRDLATSSRTQSLLAVATGTAVACGVLLIGMIISPKAIRLSRLLDPNSFHQSELLVVLCIAALVVAALLPSWLRVWAVGAVTVAEAAVLFAIPLLSWPAHETVDTRVEHFLATQVGPSYRFAGLGTPTPNLGTALGVAQLDAVDLPVPKGYVYFVRRLDPYENPTIFTGAEPTVDGHPTSAQLLVRAIPLYEHLGVLYVVTLTGQVSFGAQSGIVLAYHDARFEIWRLPHPRPLAAARGCLVKRAANGDFHVDCARPSVLLVDQLYMPGWSATVNGSAVAVHSAGHLQAILVPSGRSTVALSFLPPDVGLASLATAVAVAGLLVPWEMVATLRRRRLALSAPYEDLAVPDDEAATVTEADDRAPEPPTGAVALADIGVEESEPTTAAPLVVPDVPVTSSVASSPARDADDPPTIPVELRKKR